MPISFNTAASSNGGGLTTSSLALTIPAGVRAGDVMLVVVDGFSTAAGPVVTLTSTGTAFLRLGPQQAGGTASGFTAYGAVFYAVASPSDAGQVVTGHVSGAGSTFMAESLAAYSGASNGSTADVSGGAASGTSPLAFPAETTTAANDWAIYLSAFAETTNASFTGPAGATTRTTTESSGVGSGIWDSNGSVGPAGTSIGGPGETISSPSASVWLTAFTVGLAPAGTGAGRLAVPDGETSSLLRRPWLWR